MAISTGDRLPDGEFVIKTADGMEQRSVADIFDGRKVILVAVPGAFTPTCTNQHLPGFLDHADTMRERGVDEICFVAVNDAHVMAAWAEQTGGSGKVTFLADGNGAFAEAIGMDIDLGVAGMGKRSKRYALLADDRVVKVLNVEDSPGQAEKSSAAAIIEAL